MAWRSLWLVASLGPGLLSCGPDPGGSDPLTVAAAPSDPERRITSMIRDWFARLEDRAPDSLPIELLAGPSFELSLAEGTPCDPGEVRSWLADLRSDHPIAEFRIDEIRIEALGEDLHRAQFEFERRASDEAGLPHVARRQHTWLVRAPPGEPPVLLRIDERPLLPFPGTGPQIVCY